MDDMAFWGGFGRFWININIIAKNRPKTRKNPEKSGKTAKNRQKPENPPKTGKSAQKRQKPGKKPKKPPKTAIWDRIQPFWAN